MITRTTVFLALLVAGCTHSDSNNITASGTIEATEVIVSARVGGEIQRLLVDEGSQIRKGDTLALIDRADLLLQLKQAEANAAAAGAQHALTRRGFRREDILQAEASLANAQDDLHRAHELVKAQTITQKQFDDTRTRFVIAQQAYDKLRRGSRPEEIEAARARMDLAAAQVEAIRKRISDSYVVAPMQGVIADKAVEEGEMVLPNGTLFRIARVDQVHLMIYISEVELAHVKLGQVASVYIDALPDRPFTGRITYIADEAEFTPKNVQTKDDRTKLVFGVKIGVPNPEHLLKPGMPADATIHVGG